MTDSVKEIFNEKGKELSELIQEWINENKVYISYKCNNTELQSRTKDK